MKEVCILRAREPTEGPPRPAPTPTLPLWTRDTSGGQPCSLGTPGEPELIDCNPVLCLLRVIMSVNDKWHYCHNSEVLVGSRAMRDRHLRLLGYVILQVGHAHGAPLGPVRLSEFMRESVGHLGSL